MLSFWELGPDAVRNARAFKWTQFQEGKINLGLGCTIFPTEWAGKVGPAIGRFWIGRGRAGEKLVLSAGSWTTTCPRLEEEGMRHLMAFTDAEANTILQLLGR